MKIKRKKELLEALKKITDFRQDSSKIKYCLAEILFMSLFGLLKGNVTFKDLHTWMTYNENNTLFIKLFNKERIEVPSRSTLHHLLMNTDNNELEIVFRDYFKPYIKNESIAVDGKWLRGSDANGQYTQMSHKAVLNVLDKDTKIVIGHKFLEKGKLSEIPAFKELLEDNIFSGEGQIFSFDALLTQTDILNTINKQGKRYIAKVKGNQDLLREKAKETIKSFKRATDSHSSSAFTIEGNKLTTRVVDIFEDKSCNLIMFHSDFDNIQTIIKVTKEITDNITGEVKITVEYSIANFKTTAKDFYNKILQHWRIETYHYHLDMLTREDNHIAYVQPFSMSILRSFAINLYQLFLNDHQGEKLMKAKITMAEIKRHCLHNDTFASDIFERE